MSTGKWLWSLFLIEIPIVGLITLIIWAFGDSSDARRNFSRAALILRLIVVVLSIIISIVLSWR